MGIAGLLFFSMSLLNAKRPPIFTDVYIGSNGPYRFLVDTGAQTSLIDPKLAAKLGLRPEFRVEMVTEQSALLVPGLNVRTLKLGKRALPATEVIFQPVEQARRLDRRVQGILGLNALTTFNFTLSPPDGRMDANAERPNGEVVPFTTVEGRIAVKASMGKEVLTMILDSGSNHVVLFRLPNAMARISSVPTTMRTIEGARSVVPTRWTAELSLTQHLRFETLPAAVLESSKRQADGLLPASVFKTIYVDQARHELVLVR